ncbi:MAG TPA: MFS transporter [Terriglobales bacterium]|nr:MFS transporter [Terriglobales bacterium]
MLAKHISPWWTVLAGSLGSAVGAGTIMVYAYGILAAAMGREFGWSRELLARNMTAFLVGSGIGTITLGWLISRFGIRGPSALMAGSFGLLFASVALTPASPATQVALFLVIGILGSAATALPYSVAISGFFDQRRGLALGLVVAGSGVGSALCPRVAQYLVAEHGWRTGFASIGIAAAVIAALGLIFLVRTPEGVVTKDGVIDRTSDLAPSMRAQFLNPDFWRITIPILAVSVATFGAMANLVPLFTDAKISTATIAAALSFAGLCSWAGRILIGYLMDKVFAPWVCAGVLVSAACGLLLLTAGASTLHIYAGSAMLAMAMGSEADLVTFLVSRYFRLLDYSRVVGLMWVVWAWGGGIGTFTADRSFGLFTSYKPAFLGFGGILVLGAVIVLTLGPYRHREHGLAAHSPSKPSLPIASK